jgi:phage gp36-like protein
MPHYPLRDSFGQANTCDPATVDYFVKIFGFSEALELSNIDNPTANYIDQEKIQIALNDASVLIDQYIATAPPQGKLLIAGAYRRTQATLARCYLDTLRPRQHVMDACEKALQQVELWASKSQPSAALKYQEARQYWGSCSSFVKSSYSRGRKFTDPSMLAWEKLFGSNNKRNRLTDFEAHEFTRENLNADYDCGGCGEPTIDPVLNVIDALEEARGLGNFADTHGTINPPEPTLVVADDPESPGDPNPETFSAPTLLEGEEY